MIDTLNNLNATDSAHSSSEGKPEKASRRGENLSLQDRRRGGKKSASRQTRDGSGKFAGAVGRSSGKSAASKS